MRVEELHLLICLEDMSLLVFGSARFKTVVVLYDGGGKGREWEEGEEGETPSVR